MAVDNSQTATMMIDRNFIVTYVNDQTRELLKTHQDVFRKQWPSFDASKIIGACIDQFHKIPSHQRQLLSDTSKLPYRTDIQVGGLTIALTVSAQIGRGGRLHRQHLGMGRRNCRAEAGRTRHCGGDISGVRSWQSVERAERGRQRRSHPALRGGESRRGYLGSLLHV